MIVYQLSYDEIKESILDYARKKYGIHGSLEGQFKVKVTNIKNEEFYITADVWEKA